MQIDFLMQEMTSCLKIYALTQKIHRHANILSYLQISQFLFVIAKMHKDTSEYILSHLYLLAVFSYSLCEMC